MRVSYPGHWKIFVIAAVGMIASGPLMADDSGLPPGSQKTPKEGGPRRLEVVASKAALHESPSSGSNLIDTFEQGTVFSNMGCDGPADQIWCEVRPFRGGAKGYVRSKVLQAARGPDGNVPMGEDTSKGRAGKRDFDAKGTIACAQERGQALGSCSAAVARDTGGDATIVVTFANGFERKLYFVHGEFVRASATMSGVGRDIDWRLQEGIHMLRVDDQRFELPDAFVFQRQ
ncbi:hypothetical protein [uncultured Roseibium sp.]|uniref:hypothetical protein n=1 Tax=uncultured Roseibium sp. TaxID=1936171 RepID=UPI002613CD90|nr:hypothetical protein [uncultured Roseibium sp.]